MTNMDYGQCEKCGAPNVRWRSGSVGCSAKCWLRNQPPQRPAQPQKADDMYYPGNQTQFVNKGGNLEVKKETNWDEVSERDFLHKEWTSAKISAKDITLMPS